MRGTLQKRAAAWHQSRCPQTNDPALVIIKAMEELGELAQAAHGRGDVVDEAADVLIVLSVLVGRWYPGRDLVAAAELKLETMIKDNRYYAIGDGLVGLADRSRWK